MAIIIDMNGNCTQDTDAEFRAGIGAGYSEEILSAGWTEVPREEAPLPTVVASDSDCADAVAAEAAVDEAASVDVDDFLARMYASQE